MKPLNIKEVELFIRLSNDPDFREFLSIVKESVLMLGTINAKIKDETELRWNQGRMQELLDILKKVSDSISDLNDLRKQKSRTP